jgi:hypothetical protein
VATVEGSDQVDTTKKMTISPAKVEEGRKVEMEHTRSKPVARKISLDHLKEHRGYYPALKKMEAKLEKGAMGDDRLAILKKREKKATIVKPTGALRSKLGPLKKTAAFLEAFVDELLKFAYNGGTATKTIKPGTSESTALRQALKAKGVWKGKTPGILARAADTIRRMRRPKPLSKIKPRKHYTPTPAEKDKAIASALGGSLSSMPSIQKIAGPPTLAKLRRAYPKGKVKEPKLPAVATPRPIGPDFPKAATLSGRVKYLAKRLMSPIRRLKAGDKASKAMDKGEMRKALRYGGVSAGLGPSFGREPKKAKKMAKNLEGGTNLALATKTGGVMDPLTTAFYAGLYAELEKAGMCGMSHSEAKLRAGKKKKPMKKKAGVLSNAVYKKITGKDKTKLFGKGGVIHDTDKGSSVKAKIEAARRDPSTKTNPKDTGPKGSGLQDPRAEAMKGRGFGKKAWLFSSKSGKAKAEELNKHIKASGGDVNKGVASYNAAKKKERESAKKGIGKKADVFRAAFIDELNKDAATAVPKDEPGAAKVRGAVAKILKGRRTPLHRRMFNDPKAEMARGARRGMQAAHGSKTAEEAFFSGFDKDAETAVAGPRGSAERNFASKMLKELRSSQQIKKSAPKNMRTFLQRVKRAK